MNCNRDYLSFLFISTSKMGLSYISEEAKAIYQSKDGKQEKVFDGLEWP